MIDEQKSVEAIKSTVKATSAAATKQTKAATTSADSVAKEAENTAARGDTATIQPETIEELKQDEETRKQEEAKKKKEAEEMDASERQKKIEELQKKIEELQKQMEEDLKKGDVLSYLQHQKEMEGAQNDLKILQDAEKAAANPIGHREVPGAAGTTGASPCGSLGSALPVGTSGGGGYPAGISGSGGTPASTGATGSPAQTASAPINLTGNDKKTADFINDYLAKKGSPAAGKGAGEMMVKYGKEYNVDPLVLLAIAGLETGYGKLGVGVNGMLGVGAYDSDPNNSTRNPAFSGIENQIRVGAKTFANLRAKGGSSPDAPIGEQLLAVNRAGWATDPNWHTKVAGVYNNIVADAGRYA